MYRLSILILVLLSSPLLLVAQNPARRAYISKYSGIAVREMKRSGVPASISLAQGILESDCGRSSLAVKACNHFGIKCHGWSGPGYYMDDDAKDECFRKYSNVEQSWRDHSDFLRSGSRYSFLFDLKTTDYKGWARGLKSAGYATAPDYADRLITIIEEEGLYEYDKGRISGGYAVMDPEAYPNRLEMVNGKLCFEARQGDSYSKIAEYFRISLRRLLKYNDKVRDDLQPGDIVYIQKKRSRAAVGYDYCRVREGNTIYGLSQKYGMKLKNLIKFNYYNQNSLLMPGEKVYLRYKNKEN